VLAVTGDSKGRAVLAVTGDSKGRALLAVTGDSKGRAVLAVTGDSKGRTTSTRAMAAKYCGVMNVNGRRRKILRQ